jgi:hypothetical protein
MSEEPAYTLPTSRWWMPGVPAGHRHEQMLSLLADLRTRQASRRLADEINNGMYGNAAALTFGSYTRSPATRGNRLGLNVAANMTGAVVSKIAAKNEVRPWFDPSDAPFETRMAAERVTKYVTGVLYDNDFYALGPELFRDACVFGTGGPRFFENEKREVGIRRTPVWTVTIDEERTRDTRPHELFVQTPYDKYEAMTKWPDKAKEIEVSDGADPDGVWWARGSEDVVLVSEGWRRHPGGAGRYLACIEGCDLEESAWTDPLPFAWFRWEKPTSGFYGIGLVERLRGIQNEINTLLRQIQRGHHLIAGHYLIAEGSGVTASHINNDLASMLKYKGVPPKYQAPAIIASEIYAHLRFLIEQAYQISGISQLAATSQKPAGLDSGEALRTYIDSQTERFFEVGKAWEAFVIECSRRIIECAIRIGRAQPIRLLSNKPGDLRAEKVTVADLRLALESCAIRIKSSSTIPQSAAGRIQWATDIGKSGLIPDQEDMLEIAALPDTEGYVRGKLAPRRVIQRALARIVGEGVYTPPEPVNNHELAIKLANIAYHEAVLDFDGEHEDRLEMLRLYMIESADWIERIASGKWDRLGRPVDPAMGAPNAEPAPGSDVPPAGEGGGGLPPDGGAPPPDGAAPPLAPQNGVLQ